jgi:hypothetical protein
VSGVVADISVWIDFFAGRPQPELEAVLEHASVVRSPSHRRGRARQRRATLNGPHRDRAAVLLTRAKVFARIATRVGPKVAGR